MMSLDVQADATARKLRRWLTTTALQPSSGPHAGAVAGALDADARIRFVYPEITGYYLHWLAEAREVLGPEASVRAQAAADWADRALADGHIPTTRVYLDGDDTDWRNQATFFFDLAMLLRGLCAAHDVGLIVSPQRPVQRLVDALRAFVDAQGSLVAARRHDADVVLPTRWSTIGGAFELKATSRVLLAARSVRLDDALVRACEALCDHHARTTATMPIDMLHPTLYFAEGLLVDAPSRMPEIGILLDRCLALMHDDGSLPEAEDSAVPRSDIVAQALRIGVLLAEAGLSSSARDARLDRLAGVLVRRVTDEGALPFRVDVHAPGANVWCAMFAEQALRWYVNRSRGIALPAAEWLV